MSVPVLSGRLPVVVRSMASLMESSLEDGEDPMVIANSHLEILCLVTSATEAMSFDTRELVLPLRVPETALFAFTNKRGW